MASCSYQPLEFPKLQQVNGPGGRYYTFGGTEKYSSITTLLGKQPKPYLVEWRKRVGAEEAQKITTAAATRGTKLHTICEQYLLGDKKDFPDAATRFRFELLRPYLDRISVIYGLESKVYSPRLEVSGTFDCMAVYDGKLCIIDFKTSRKIKRKEWIKDYFHQTCFYAMCMYELGLAKPTHLLILMVSDDGEVEEFLEPLTEWTRPTISLIRHCKTL